MSEKLAKLPVTDVYENTVGDDWRISHLTRNTGLKDPCRNQALDVFPVDLIE